MGATLQRFRRGTDAQINDPSFLIGEGELVYATDTKIMYLGDSGGNKIPQVLGKDDDLLQLQTLYSGDGQIETIGTVINITTNGTYDYNQGRWFWFKADTTIIKPVGISVNGGTALVARDGTGAEVDVEENKIYLCSYDEAGASFFQLASGDSGGDAPVVDGVIAWSEKFDGINDAITDVKGNLVNVEVGDYVYNERGETKIVISGGVVPNPDYGTWEEGIATPDGNYYHVVSVGDCIYYRDYANSNFNKLVKYDTVLDTFDSTLPSCSLTIENFTKVGTDIYVGTQNSPYRLFKFDTLTETWDETLTPPDARFGFIQAVGTDIFCKNNVTNNRFKKYDTLLDSWTYGLASTSTSISYSAVVGTNLYTTKGGNTLIKYDTVLDSWDETLTLPSNSFREIVGYGKYVYARQTASTYAMWRYDTELDSWDESLDSPSGYWEKPVVVNDQIYVKQGVSTYDFWKFDAIEETGSEVAETFPARTDAVTGSELMSSVSGVLRFQTGTVVNTPYTGFKTDKNLID